MVTLPLVGFAAALLTAPAEMPSAGSVFTYGRLNMLTNPVASGDRIYALSNLNDGSTGGTSLNSIRKDGSIVWSTNLTKMLGSYRTELWAAPKGAVTVTGFSQKSKEAIVARINPNGKLAWRKVLPIAAPSRYAERGFTDDKGNAVLFHGPVASISMFDSSGKVVWTYRLSANTDLDSVAFMGDRTVALTRPLKDGKATTIVQLDKKGKVIAKLDNAISGFRMAIRGEKVFSQVQGKRASSYHCYNLRTGRAVWSTTGPLAFPRYSVVGPKDELSVAWANNSRYTLGHFSSDGKLAWVKRLDNQWRLDAIRASGPGRVQALVVNYNMSGTALAEYKGGHLVSEKSLPLGSLSGNNEPFAELGNKLYIFNVIGEFNPGETKATGIIAKVWRLPAK